MLQGEKVRLRAVQKTDLASFFRYVNDPEITRFLLIDPPFCWEQEEFWYQQTVQGRDITYTIETLEGRVIGNITLHKVDYANRKAVLGIMIGEVELQNQGLGTDAIITMLGLAFDELNLERVCLIADVRNVRAIRCYEKCGFKHEGVMRHARFKGGQYIDDVVMSILKEEWRARPKSSGPTLNG